MNGTLIGLTSGHISLQDTYSVLSIAYPASAWNLTLDVMPLPISETLDNVRFFHATIRFFFMLYYI